VAQRFSAAMAAFLNGGFSRWGQGAGRESFFRSLLEAS